MKNTVVYQNLSDCNDKVQLEFHKYSSQQQAAIYTAAIISNFISYLLCAVMKTSKNILNKSDESNCTFDNCNFHFASSRHYKQISLNAFPSQLFLE